MPDVANLDRELLGVALASIGDAVITADSRGRVTYLNAAAESLTGWKNGEAAGQPLDAVCRIVKLQAAAVLVARDGTERPVDDRAVPVRGKDGEVVGRVLVFRDITERKRQEAAQAELMQRVALQTEERERLLLTEAATANAKFRAFFEQGALFAGIMDVDGTIIEPNRLSWEGCGYTREQIVGKPFWDCPWWTPSPALVERIKAASAQAAAGWTFRAEMPYFVADGSERMVDIIILPIRDEAGQVVFLAPTGTDITDRKGTEERLRESEERFRQIAEGVDTVFYVTDIPAKRVRYVSPAFTRLWGVAAEELYRDQQTWVDRIHPADRPGVTGEFEAFLKGGPAYDAEYRIGLPDGGERWIRDRATAATRESNGHITRVTGIAEDVTDRKKIEEERKALENDLRKLAADLSKADHRKDEFLATLAHELRNPLAPIGNGLYLLKMAGQSGQAEQIRTMMERQLTQMVRLVDDLLDVSRITQDKLELRKERVELSAVVNSAVETSRPLIESCGHELTVSVPSAPIYLDADLTRLAQVFSNLLNNAAKYTEKGGRVRLTAERRGDEVVVSVMDTGIGIPPAMLPKVFDMFTQGDRTLERAQGGLGIGLTLVRRLAEMHGGTVKVLSEGPGQGSEFVVRLPVLVERPAIERPAIEGPAPALAAGKPGAVNARRVLVVDDNQDSATSLAMLLTLEGDETKVAHDGLEALEAAATFRPDVVLLDIGMPKLNGYEVARRIREQPWGGSMVLVALTGWGQEEDRRKSRDAGFNAHLVKPVDYAALIKLLAELLAIESAG